MEKMHRTVSVILLAVLILSACNLPSNNPGSQGSNGAMTAAAQTITAQLTAIVPITATVPVVVPGTNTPITVPPTAIPPATSLPAATAICDGAQFIADVTVPDDTVFTPSQAFTKTWRFKNIGTCSWTPSYSVAFFDGNAMNGPATQALVGNVNPGQTVDISVNLTAPAAPGNYTGNYRLRNAAGLLFSKFYVQIKVQAAAPPPPTTAVPPPPSSHTVNLAYMSGESGLVLDNGSSNLLTVAAGDSTSNKGVEAFLSFDISGVPAGSTIQNASLLLKGGSQVRGDPFATLGCLRAYVQNYGTVDASDFVPVGALSSITRWCNTSELETPYSDAGFISAVQGAVGSSRFQIRLQFKDTLTDSDGTIDDVLILAPVTLTVTYLAP
ncbi:MAG: NBR1-Ig-like domain-containing protein [Anaerolineales bacterium]|nr:NBR1-Ig-like domain-containing protein [Anaerolineales bacterium]